MLFRANKTETMRVLSAVVPVTALIAIALVMPAQAQTSSGSSSGETASSTSQSSADGTIKYYDNVATPIAKFWKY
jgi:hypothetical protein